MNIPQLRYAFRTTVIDDLKGVVNTVKGCVYMLRKYSWKRIEHPLQRPMLVFNVTEDFYSGGMADRFKGAVTAYAYCKQRNIDFRIRYIYPFNLEDYLQPAEYDWILKEGEYIQNIHVSELMYARAEHGRRLLRKKLGRRQLHFYGNYNNLPLLNSTGNTAYDWGTLFRELFTPSQVLEAAITSKKKEIGSDYISAVFRFQNLLGDFKEYKFESIKNESQRNALVTRCVEGLHSLHEKYPDKTILVTSDSSTFIETVSALPYVYVVRGCRVHMGSTPSATSYTYMNSFLDFYLLSDSNMIFSIGTKDMYPTQFPLYAAKVNNVPFERIIL